MTSEWELVLRMVIATLLGGAIGWDREAANQPAGVRTHMLVAAGAALFVAASILILGDVEQETASGYTHVPAAIVTGVGFLGAGAIIRFGHSVTGMATAAGLWVTGAIGLLVGAGFFVIGTVATVFLLLMSNGTRIAWQRTTERKDSD
jgi:putative Mg2+ transporter-C (MgtC) family protein